MHHQRQELWCGGEKKSSRFRAQKTYLDLRAFVTTPLNFTLLCETGWQYLGHRVCGEDDIEITEGKT